MSNTNVAIISGRFGSDPESKAVSSGSQVTNFSLAVNYTWKNKEGVSQISTSWIPCEAWNGIGVNIAKYCKKGSFVTITGSLRQNSWTSPEGDKRSRLKVLVNSIEFIPTNSGTVNKEEGQAEPLTPPAIEEVQDDDVPF